MVKNKSNSKFLLDSSPMVFYPEVAKILGTNEAIFLQQLNYWIQKNDTNPTHYKEGRIWVWNKLEEWQEYNFIMWSVSTIRRILDSLVSKKIIIKKKFNLNKDKWAKDHTLWYTIDYDVLDQYLLECEKPENQRKRYKNPMDIANTDNSGFVQVEQMISTNGSHCFESSKDQVEKVVCGKTVDNTVENLNENNDNEKKETANADNSGFVQDEQKHMVNLNKSNCSNWTNLHITENTTTETTITEKDNSVSAETPLSDIWEVVKGNLKTNDKCKMTEVSIKTWIEQLNPIEIKSNTILLQTNKKYVKEIIELKFNDLLFEAAKMAGLKNFIIKIGE